MTERKLRRPNVETRTLLIGSTGSGKTTAGAYHLSMQNFDDMPWTIVDTKRETIFQQIPLLVELPLDAKPPSQPGLYVIRIRPGYKDELDALERYLHAVHEHGNHGLFVDEGYAIYPARKRGALTNILTQGRSLHTPVIMNTQRPANIGVEALSEASFFQVYDLTRPDDRKTVQEYIPVEQFNFSNEIDRYHSVWRDTSEKITRHLPPVRPGEASVAEINRRLDLLYRQRKGVRQLVASEGKGEMPRLRVI